MNEPEITSTRFTCLERFLDCLLIDPVYQGFIERLRELPSDRFYEEYRWHGVEELLEPFPEASKALNGFAFKGWDSQISFSTGNLKACYILDEDFVNDGRAFVLFNLVASNWTYITTVDNQQNYWKVNS